jgi:FAD:protein FMN transferase
VVAQVKERYIGKFKALGSVCEIQLYHDSSSEVKKILEVVRSEVDRFEETYSRYRPSSWLSQVNREAHQHCFKLNSEMTSLFSWAKSWWERSSGYFDPTAGVLNQLWKFKGQLNEQHLPTIAQVQSVLGLIGYEKVNLSVNGLQFALAGVQIDLGGFGKEYLVDLVADMLSARGIKNCLVNFGGDLRAVGGHHNGDPWEVGISHPNEPSKPFTIYRLKDASLASSGDYQRFMVLKNQRYSHILNPKTGFPVQGDIRAVTVVAKKCADAGVLATLGMIVEYDFFKELLQGYAHDFLFINKDLNAFGSFYRKSKC